MASATATPTATAMSAHALSRNSNRNSNSNDNGKDMQIGATMATSGADPGGMQYREPHVEHGRLLPEYPVLCEERNARRFSASDSEAPVDPKIAIVDVVI